MIDEQLFKGIALVIDDELHVEQSSIFKIREQLQAAGGHVLGLTELPKKDADLGHFSGVAFVLLDWNLIGSTVGASENLGVSVPDALASQQQDDIVEFLLRLKTSRYVPVFIFTNESVETVEGILRAKAPGLYPKGGQSHLLVKDKAEVINQDVFAVLNDWIKSRPSAMALKIWEQEYDKAKNELFLDFYNDSVYWPAILWQTFEQDGVSGSDELGLLISRNLLSRMAPFRMDMSGFTSQLAELKEADEGQYRQSLLKVLEGERFVLNQRLHDDSTTSGDVFKKSGKYYINIRPACDCVSRDGNPDIQLYLLKGLKLTPKQLEGCINRKRGLLTERDDEAIVFGLQGGESVSFRLKSLHLEKWSDFKDKRIGRLLPPFSTRVQQRYASYLQRPGIPRIPREALPPAPPPDQPAAETDALTTNSIPAASPYPTETVVSNLAPVPEPEKPVSGEEAISDPNPPGAND